MELSSSGLGPFVFSEKTGVRFPVALFYFISFPFYESAMKVLLFLLFSFISVTASADINEVNNSVCKTTSVKEGFMCTAFAFNEDESNIYCLSCGHCYKEEDVILHLSHNTNLKLIMAKAIYHKFINNTSTDVTIIEVAKKDFQDYPLLRPLKFADSVPKKDEIMWTHGCSLGSWPSAYKGRILPVQDLSGTPIVPDDGMIYFSPAANVGRSGSPILNDSYEVVGMVNMKAEKGNEIRFGIGVSSTKLLELIKEYDDKNSEDK